MMNPTQTSSSSGNDSQQIKYQRALKEIKKVVNANKILKQENQETRIQLEQRIRELTQKLNETKERYQIQHKERLELEKYIDQLQDRNSVIRKEHQASEKELLYLNEMIAEQTEELKKLSIFRNQKKIGNIIKTYEEKEEQSTYQKIGLQNKIKQLQQKVEQVYRQTQQDRTAKGKAQQKYFILQKELQSFRELYLSTVQRHEKYIQDSKDSDKARIKEKLLSELIKQFKQQIDNLKQTQKQANMSVISNRNYEKNFEVLLEDKTKISVQLVNLKNQYEIAQERIEQSFIIEQKLREAVAKAQRLTEEVNMLKSKVVILETKDIVNEEMENEEYLSQVSQSKVIEEKISYLLAQADPLATIKNSEDSSHFRVLSTYVAEMRDKLNKAYAQNKDLSLRNRALSSKRHRNQPSGNTEYNVDVLLGKVQSYERLAEKLQNELEKSIRMNDVYMKKAQQKQMKASQMRQNELEEEINIIKYQIEQTESRAGQAEKRVINQVYQLKKKIADKNLIIQEKDSKIKELQNCIKIYEQKFQVITRESEMVDKENMRLHDQLMRIKQETMQLQLKVDSFLLQKQEYNRIVHEEARNNTIIGDVQINSKINSLESKIRILNGENQRLQRQYENSSKQAVTFKKQLQQFKDNYHFELSKLQKENQFYKEEQQYYSEAQKTIRDLEKELEMTRLRAGKYHSDSDRVNELEDELTRKDEQIGQLKRKLTNYETSYEELKYQRDRLEFDLRGSDRVESTFQVDQERRKTKIFESELNNERQRNIFLENQLSEEKNRVFNLESKIRQLQIQLEYAKSASSIRNNQEQGSNWQNNRVNQSKPKVRISSSVQYADQLKQSKQLKEGDTYGRIVTAVPSRYRNQVDTWNYQVKGQPDLIQRESYEVKSIDSARNSQQFNLNANANAMNANTNDDPKVSGFDVYQMRTITSVGFNETPISGNSRIHNLSAQMASIGGENQGQTTLSNQAIKTYPSFEEYKASFKFIKEEKQPEQKRIY